MTQHITTGPHPGHTGACMAQYNHYTHSHSPNHNPNNHSPIQYPNYPQGFQGIPSLGQPVTQYPFYY